MCICKNSSHSSVQTCRATMMDARISSAYGERWITGYVFTRYFSVLQSERVLPEPWPERGNRQKSRLRAEIGGRPDDDGSDLARHSSRINILCRCSTPRRWQRLLKAGVISSWRRPGVINRTLSPLADAQTSLVPLRRGACARDLHILVLLSPFRAIRAISQLLPRAPCN